VTLVGIVTTAAISVKVKPDGGLTNTPDCVVLSTVALLLCSARPGRATAWHERDAKTSAPCPSAVESFILANVSKAKSQAPN
jgi:hypothetical protein